MKHENFKYFFTANIKNIRRKEKLLQKEMADKLGVSQKMVGAIEEGRALSIVAVYNASRSFGYTIDELITQLI